MPAHWLLFCFLEVESPAFNTMEIAFPLKECYNLIKRFYKKEGM